MVKCVRIALLVLSGCASTAHVVAKPRLDIRAEPGAFGAPGSPLYFATLARLLLEDVPNRKVQAVVDSDVQYAVFLQSQENVSRCAVHLRRLENPIDRFAASPYWLSLRDEPVIRKSAELDGDSCRALEEIWNAGLDMVLAPPGRPNLHAEYVLELHSEPTVHISDFVEGIGYRSGYFYAARTGCPAGLVNIVHILKHLAEAPTDNNELSVELRNAITQAKDCLGL